MNKITENITNELNKKIEIILNKFSSVNFLTRNHVSSYDIFLSQLDSIIKEYNNKIIAETIIKDCLHTYTLKINSSRLGRNCLKEVKTVSTKNLSHYAINANGTLVIDFFATIAIELRKKETDELINSTGFSEVLIAKIPLLVGSKYYTEPLEDWELKGFFIVKGAQRHLLSLEENSHNRLIITKKDNTMVGKIISSASEYKVINKVTVKEDIIEFSFRSNNLNFNALEVLYALGLSKEQIIEYICKGDEEIKFYLLAYFENIEDKDTVLEEDKNTFYYEKIKKLVSFSEEDFYNEKKLRYILNSYILVNITEKDDSFAEKSKFLCTMINKTIKVYLGKKEIDDIDDLRYKRIRRTGYLFKELFTKQLYYLITSLTSSIIKHNINSSLKLTSIIDHNIISKKFITCLSSGNWVNNLEKITAIVERNNFILSLGNFQRITSPLNKELQIKGTRDLRVSHKKRFCLIDTPTSKGVGLVKNLALGTLISSNRSGEEVISALKHHKVFRPSGTEVWLNGCKIGYTKNKAASLRLLKYNNDFPLFFDLQIIETEEKIYLNSDSGRILRALLIKSDRMLEFTNETSIFELVEKGILTFIDYEEEENCKVHQSYFEAENEELFEISDILLFGITGSLVPYGNYNQPGKATTAIKGIKQAIGRYISKEGLTKGYVKHLSSNFCKNPLVNTSVYYSSKLRDFPFGQNVVVAVMSYDGLNQQDALLVNESSIKRGLFEIDSHKNYTEEIYTKDKTKIVAKPEQFSTVEEEQLFSKIQNDGLPKIGEKIVGSVPIIGILNRYVGSMTLGANTAQLKNNSVYSKNNTDGLVKHVFVGLGKDNYLNTNVIIEESKKLKVGDKISSRHGQKGIVASIKSEEQLPFVKETGLVPDVFVSPYCVASRMTLGQLIEPLAGKTACLDGEIQDSTAFNNNTELIDNMNEVLEKNGFLKRSREVMVNPETGQEYEVLIFTGCSYYLRLNWLIDERVHVRRKGVYQLLTGQPTAGRTKKGGLKMGEMERDAIVAHGACFLINERFSSDVAISKINLKTGSIAETGLINNYDLKEKTSDLVGIKLPYIVNLLYNELLGLHINLKFEINYE